MKNINEMENSNEREDIKIGDRIKKLRLHYNMSLRDFALKCNVSYVMVHKYESRRKNLPNISTLNKIADIFGTTIEWLIEGKGEMLPKGLNFKVVKENELHSFWQDEAFMQQEARIEHLEKENVKLWGIINHFTATHK